MKGGLSPWQGALVVILVACAHGQEDSLQSALDAVDRRERDLADGPYLGDIYAESGYSKYPVYDNERDELAFLNSLGGYTDDSVEPLEERNDHGDDDVRKRVSSSFRERMEEDKENERKKLTNLVLNKIEEEYEREDEQDRNMKYQEEMKQLMDKYQYKPRYPRRARVSERMYEQHVRKRFPVSKRNSYYNSPSTFSKRNQYQTFTRQHKRSSKTDTVPGTDPKIMKDLSSIFGAKEGKKKDIIDNKKKLTTQKPNKAFSKSNKTIASNDFPKSEHDKKKDILNKEKTSQEEIVPEQQKDHHIKIKKKSIDWSNYFGLDRRKKSPDNNDVDNEWLMERYHKSIALTTKRNGGSPLQNFREKDELRDKKKSNTRRLEESKLDEMDNKFKNVEDLIVEEALKYTGAHEGATDSKEVQEVKGKVISSLAAAYSLEKMRRALSEFKQSLAKQRNAIKDRQMENEDEFYADKRVAVPRKQAIDEERDKEYEADNNIKCAQGSEECDEQSYRSSKDLPDEFILANGNCPKIQEVCKEASKMVGQFAHIFENACNWHQMCLICVSNKWFVPSMQCNFFFLTKADELCADDEECQKAARKSVRFLLNVSRTLRAEPTGECDLICPENRP